MRSDAVANRERILCAARDVFAEQGISAEIKDIADRAGIGVGTIYRNFPGKNDLMIELIRGMMREIAGILGEAEADDDPILALRLALRGMYDVAERHGWIMDAKITGRLPEEVRHLVLPPHKDARFQALVRIMERAKERGLIREDVDTSITIVMMFSTVYPLARGHARAGRGTDALAETVIDLLLTGIETRVPAQASR